MDFPIDSDVSLAISGTVRPPHMGESVETQRKKYKSDCAFFQLWTPFSPARLHIFPQTSTNFCRAPEDLSTDAENRKSEFTIPRIHPPKTGKKPQNPIFTTSACHNSGNRKSWTKVAKQSRDMTIVYRNLQIDRKYLLPLIFKQLLNVRQFATFALGSTLPPSTGSGVGDTAKSWRTHF
jgi:hypothetical protein